jgi:RNA polymerase sigma-70 factor, ECF subfamily
VDFRGGSKALQTWSSRPAAQRSPVGAENAGAIWNRFRPCGHSRVVPHLTDALLWERIRSGDADAFGELYERHGRAVQSFCLWGTVDLQSAEDATATVFLEAWRKRRRIALTTESAVPLLLGFATNVLREQRRGRRRYAAALERMRDAALPNPSGHEDEAIARLDAMRQLRDAGAAVRALPRREREVLALIAWAELTYEEVAVALGIPTGTVRSRLARARNRLGEAFGDPLPAPIRTEEP